MSESRLACIWIDDSGVSSLCLPVCSSMKLQPASVALFFVFFFELIKENTCHPPLSVRSRLSQPKNFFIPPNFFIYSLPSTFSMCNVVVTTPGVPIVYRSLNDVLLTDPYVASGRKIGYLTLLIILFILG
jgi:hypothetical protein